MNLTPEQMQAILGMSAYDDQERMIEQQLAQANALRNRPQSQHTTGAGAALGGMGDMLNAYRGNQQAKQLQSQQQQMQQQYIAALRGLAAPQQQPGGDMPSYGP